MPWNNQAPGAAGTNAAEFGFSRGDWAAVEAQPYFSANRAQGLSTKPADATKFCVTVATSAHALDNPELFQCVDIPEA